MHQVSSSDLKNQNLRGSWSTKLFFKFPHCVFKFFFHKGSYLRKTGWIHSFFCGYPCDQAGSPVPWMNYSLVAFLRQRINSDMTMFEFGSGYSTLFFSELVRNVTSVEHNHFWYQAMAKRLPANASILFEELDVDGEYARSCLKTQKAYDLILVDGRDRVNCVKQSLQLLSPSGVIILDDSHRSEYNEAKDFAKRAGYKCLELEGIKPLGVVSAESTIIYRPTNCLGI